MKSASFNLSESLDWLDTKPLWRAYASTASSDTYLEIRPNCHAFEIPAFFLQVAFIFVCTNTAKRSASGFSWFMLQN